ncbi:MAG: hypothetical protein JO131_04990 [Gammaproteobacteria bacterium]|nr:hypothetical protein [Gammaproteobacteria bacterium]
MFTHQLHFFHLRSNLDIQKNKLSEHDPSFQHMKFLILMLQISYFFDIQLFLLRIHPGQTRVVRTVFLLCGGMLIFLTLTIYLFWAAQYQPTFNLKQGLNFNWHYFI